MQKTISELGCIRRKVDFPHKTDDFNEIYLNEFCFEQLKQLTFNSDADFFLSYSIKKGKEQITVKNYVGIIEVGKTVIEILPKNTSDSVEDGRKTLLQMLSLLPNSPFKIFQKAFVSTAKLPLHEVFITVFLQECEKLLNSGLPIHFQLVESNQTYLKGKLKIEQNIQQNSLLAHQFYICFDAFQANFSLNRIIKTTLFFLQSKSFNISNQLKINQLLNIFQDISVSKNIIKDFEECKLLLNNLKEFEWLIECCQIFLQKLSFSPYSGKASQFSLLFPTEKLFENYVAKLVKKHLPISSNLSIKENSKHLIFNHLNKPRFKLIPDLCIETDTKRIIIDTKWKLIDEQRKSKNYGIDQTDVYQMYAYGKKYQADTLILLYPASKSFQQPLQVFNYEHELKLWVLPFDCSNQRKTEINQLFSYFL